MIRKCMMLGLLAGLLATGTAAAHLLHDGHAGRAAGAALAEVLRPLGWSQPEPIRRTMQDPDCWTMFRRHRTGGGTLSYQDFAWRYAATGGFRR